MSGSHHCMVVEDAVVGVEAARAAGMAQLVVDSLEAVTPADLLPLLG